MNNKLVLGALGTCFAVTCFNANAAVVSTDWQTPGDNLITLDDVSGLQWLDLTETYGLMFDYVSGQFDVGSEFEGFRYATDAEVQALWSNFGIDLSTGAPTSVAGADPNVEIAAGILGNTWNIYAFFDYPFGASGITANTGGTGHSAMGAYQTDFGFTTYETIGTITSSDTLTNIQPYGSYLVMGSPVPVPAAVWLFGSGLLGLIGIMGRKKV